MANVTPPSLEIPFSFGENDIRLVVFSNVIIGRQFIQSENYRRIPTPELPTASMSNIQEWYVTPQPDAFGIPLFPHLPVERFSDFDTYHTVTAVDQYRIDLISYNYYGTVDYAWIILFANGIIDPFSLVPGQILRIPSPETVVNNWINPL